jgi:hypothetical protein
MNEGSRFGQRPKMKDASAITSALGKDHPAIKRAAETAKNTPKEPEGKNNQDGEPQSQGPPLEET